MPKRVRTFHTRSLIPNAHSAIFHRMHNAIFVLDMDNRVVDCNLMAEKLVNQPRKVFIGKKVRVLIEYLAPSIESNDNYTEVCIARPDDIRYFDLNFFPILQRRKLVGRIITLHDITHLKQIEAQTKYYLEELTIANEELQAFDHTIAHDLKTPLTAIMGYIELLLTYEKGLSEQGIKHLESIYKSTEKMAQMINDLLLLSRVGHTETESVSLNIMNIVDSVIDRFHAQIRQANIEMIIAPDLANAMGHALWVEAIFTNLISNAIKYIGKNNPAPRIIISGMLQGDRVHYEVRDNGLGIAPQDKAILFDLFTRFHKDEAEGVGLGLSIVARIVKRLGGEMGVESTVGTGSTFWFTLPAPK